MAGNGEPFQGRARVGSGRQRLPPGGGGRWGEGGRHRKRLGKASEEKGLSGGGGMRLGDSGMRVRLWRIREGGRALRKGGGGE